MKTSSQMGIQAQGGTRALYALTLAASFAGANAIAIPTVDLTSATSGMINGAVFVRETIQPTGTGVFQPFLDLSSNGTKPNTGVEQAYNTEGGGVLDAQRAHWNHDLRFGQLLAVNLTGYSGTFFRFTLDANEPGQGSINRLLSIDNIRIYTSPADTGGTSNPDALGTLRYNMNDPIVNPPPGGFNYANWVLIDSTFGSAGSGDSDMSVYVPTSLFAGVGEHDFVYFYNLNGVHESADPGTGSDSGYEEWRALSNPNYRPPGDTVPDGGATVALLGLGLAAMGASRRFLKI